MNKFRLSSDIMESRRTYSTEGSSLHPQLGSIRVHQRRLGSAYSRNGSTRSSAGSGKSLTGSGKFLTGSGKSLTGSGKFLTGSGKSLTESGKSRSGSVKSLRGSGKSLTGSGKSRSGSVKARSGSGKPYSGSGISGVSSYWLAGENAGIPFVVTSKARDTDSFFSIKSDGFLFVSCVQWQFSMIF